MGNYQFIPRPSLNETLQDLDYYCETLKIKEEQEEKQDQLIEQLRSIVEKYREHLVINASSFKTTEELHTEIAKLTESIKYLEKEHQIKNREYAINVPRELLKL